MKKLYNLGLMPFDVTLKENTIDKFELLGYLPDGNLKFKLLTKDDISNKTFYRGERIKFPKAKEHILKDKYNIKITRDVNKADYIIENEKSFNIYKTYSYGSYSTVDKFKNAILSYSENIDQDFKDSINYIFKDLNPDDLLKITLLNNYRRPRNKLIDAITYRKPDIILENTTLYYMQAHLIVKYNNLLTQNIVLDQTLMDIISDEQFNIDDNTYYELDRLLKSNYKKDNALALETMTNINFNTGGDILVYLYNKYRNNMLRYLNNWNSVNVKTFRAKMDKYHATYYSRTMYDVLKENNLLTNFIFNIYLQDVLNRSIDLNLKLVNHNVIIDNSMNSDFVNLRT